MTTRTSIIVLEVQDKYSAALTKFSAGMQKGTDAMKQMAGAAPAAATATDVAGQKMEATGRKAEQMGDKLQRAFGGSSRAVNVFGNALSSAVGLTGPLSYSLDVLIDSGAKAALAFTGMTLATGAIAGAVKIATDAIDKMKVAQDGQIEAQTKIIAISIARNVSLQEATRLYAALNPTLIEDARAQADLATKIIRVKEAEEALLHVVKELQNTPIQQMALNAARAELQAAEAVLFRARAYEQLRKNREAAYSAVPSLQLGGVYSPFSGNDFDPRDMTMVDPREWTQQNEAFKRGRTQEKEQADAAARQRGSAQSGIVRQMQNDALSIYKRLAADSDVTAKEIQATFTNAFVNIIEAQAQMNDNANINLIALQQNFSDVFANMSQDTVGKLLGIMNAGGEMAQGLIQQLYQIAAAGGSAVDMANALTAAINAIPTNKIINIRYNVTGAGPGVGWGNQQGNEWDFTLEGEPYAVRKAYMDQYGDYGRANEAWKAAHAAELKAKGVPPPEPQAFGMHSVATRPQLLLVGERGPERVDITPGTGARQGMGGDGAVAVNINSLTLPNEFEVQQLAMRLKKYMRM